jgi:hypothetical protein
LAVYQWCRTQSSWNDAQKLEILKAKLDAGVKLVDHEDKHTWNKFYTMLYFNLGLLAAYGYAAGAKDGMLGAHASWFMIALALAGVVAAVGFGLTLWSGVSCLVSSKMIVLAVDRHFAGVGDSPKAFINAEEQKLYDAGIKREVIANIFLGKDGPSRILLRWGPVILCMLWFWFLVLPIVFSLTAATPRTTPPTDRPPPLPGAFQAGEQDQSPTQDQAPSTGKRGPGSTQRAPRREVSPAPPGS